MNIHSSSDDFRMIYCFRGDCKNNLQSISSCVNKAQQKSFQWVLFSIELSPVTTSSQTNSKMEHELNNENN